MKHEIRILTLVLLLLWGLAWSGACRTDVAVTPAQEVDITSEPLAAAETAQSGTPDGERMLRVLHGGSVEEMTMRDYLQGVLRAEMPASFELEALKAQAIAARTYTLHKMRGGTIANHPDADACDDINCCKAYKTAEDAAADWGSMALYYEEKLARAIAETDGQAILYDASAVWQTDLPYLQSVSSPEDETLVPNYYSVARFSAEEFRSLFLRAHPDADLSGAVEGWVRDVVRSDADYVTSLRVGGVTVRGNELRTILSLRSPSFTVKAEGDTLVFHVTGYGHGVGMSQYGANALALQGTDAAAILEHYFPGARVQGCAS